jgi:deoxycytidylate deaminase
MVHCTDGGCPRATSTVTPGTGYDDPAGFCVAQHAEAGALLWSDPAVRNGGTLVVNGPPCLECARLVASAGIKRVVHTMNDDYPGWPAVARFLGHAGVDVVGCPAPAGDMIVVTDSTGTELSRIEGEDATRVIEAGVRLLVTEAMRWPR